VVGENCILGIFCSKYSKNYQDKEDLLGRACRMLGKKNVYMMLGGKAKRKEATGMTYRQIGG
jgi:hypothetical protein